MEEFMKRNNNNGGALSNSYKDFRQALNIAAKLEIPMPLGVDGQSNSGNGPRRRVQAL